MSEPTPPKLFRLLVPVSAALALAGLGAFVWASQNAPAPDTVVGATPVAVTTKVCEPMEITVAAGRRSFEITNASDRPIEWEILDGVMVVAERENIVPGMKQILNVTLAPGEYAMTCGLLTNPRGVLRVSESQEWDRASATVELRDFLGALGEYKVYLVMQGNDAIKRAEELRDAIASGDLAASQAAWLAARAPYKRIEPLAFRISDMEDAIDPLADMLEQQEDVRPFRDITGWNTGCLIVKASMGWHLLQKSWSLI